MLSLFFFIINLADKIMVFFELNYVFDVYNSFEKTKHQTIEKIKNISYMTFLTVCMGMSVLALSRIIYISSIHSFFSEKTIKIIEDRITIPAGFLTFFFNQTIFSSLKLNEFKFQVGVVIAEEILFRKIIQSYSLYKIPQKIIKTINPEYKKVVDKKISKNVRALLTALIFSLSHTRFKNINGGGVPQLFCGLIYCGFYEKNSSLIETTLAHYAHNAFFIQMMKF